ncbi:MAG TPA: mandelate racemase [Dehalococcoidia bacterium]|nr:mandelate racemase [Dehalococcoidia bacterium]|tara:strand:+ start:207 stop:1307 length:1101 start_codon:yes stop_codon:yes gene_type:complete
MKIIDVTVTLTTWDTPQWTSGTSSFGGDKQLGIVTIKTDEGFDGYGFLGSTRLGAESMAGPLIEFVKPMLLGANPLDIHKIWNLMWRQNRNISTHIIGAVDIALWDIAGKRANLPIHRLLGTARDTIPAYASSPTYPDIETYVEEALKFKQMGWSAYKIHPQGDPKMDIVIAQKVREAVGDDYTLMLDSMWSYYYEEAMKVGRAIEELDYYWYEDPLVEEDIYNYTKLNQKLDIPIMSTEYTPGRFYGVPPWIINNATDILRGDVAVTGGITPLIKLTHLADGFRMKCELHHGGNSLNNVANLHVIMATPNTDFYEVFPSTGANKFGLIEDVEVNAEGMVLAPTKPGLSYDIDWDLVKSKQTDVIS